MKKLLLILFSMFVLCTSSFASCYYAESEAYDAYRDAKKAYRASSLSSCKSYARKAYKHASYAESESGSCN